MSDVYVRCDAKDCGARSYVTVLMFSGSELDYCGHHATLYWGEAANLGLGR